MPVTNWGTVPMKPSDFFGRLEDEVRSKTGLPTTDAFLTIAGDQYHLKSPPCDNFVTIYPPQLPVWQGVVSGGGQAELLAGSAHVGFDAVIIITWFCRLSGDQEFRSSELIRSNSMGLLNQVSRMVGGLQFWECPHTADDTTSPLREYMRVTQGPAIAPREYQTGLWALAKTTFEAKFSADLT
jgi:hypothetical protein